MEHFIPFTLSWDPFFPIWLIIVFIILSFIFVISAYTQGHPKGILWRFVACLSLSLWLSNPRVIKYKSRTLNPTVLIVIDQSDSMSIKNRTQIAQAALHHLKTTMPSSIKTKIIEIHNHQQGTQIFSTLKQIINNQPSEEINSIIVISDGQIHDVPQHPLIFNGKQIPLYFMLTAAHEETDRHLQILYAPPYVTVGNSADIKIQVNDIHSASPSKTATLEINCENQPLITKQIPLKTPYTLHIPITHTGKTTIGLSISPLKGEVSTLNNRQILQINGIKKKLNILLISGSPNQNTRNWRTLLKSDPMIDLIHFSILRTAEQDPDVTDKDLALIPFPVNELFLQKLHEFDLVIFDSFTNLGLMPSSYIENLRKYIENGGGLLLIAGPEYVQKTSLQNSPLYPILPAYVSTPQAIITTAFQPRLTSLGKKHPVTAFLNKIKTPLHPWYRFLKTTQYRGQVLMQTTDQSPLLILNSVQKGRIALFLSDQLWLWSKTEPDSMLQNQLLRRLIYWLMKEPALEPEQFKATFKNAQIHIQWHSLSDSSPQQFTLISPSHKIQTLTLSPNSDHGISHFLNAYEKGIWQIIHHQHTLYLNASFSDPLEFTELNATRQKIRSFLKKNKGHIYWLGDHEQNLQIPTIHLVSSSTFTSQQHNINIPVIRISTKEPTQKHLLPEWLILIIILGSLLRAWYKENVSS